MYLCMNRLYPIAGKGAMPRGCVRLVPASCEKEPWFDQNFGWRLGLPRSSRVLHAPAPHRNPHRGTKWTVRLLIRPSSFSPCNAESRFRIAGKASASSKHLKTDLAKKTEMFAKSTDRAAHRHMAMIEPRSDQKSAQDERVESWLCPHPSKMSLEHLEHDSELWIGDTRRPKSQVLAENDFRLSATFRFSTLAVATFRFNPRRAKTEHLGELRRFFSAGDHAKKLSIYSS
jgi:hypothetical protein